MSKSLVYPFDQEFLSVFKTKHFPNFLQFTHFVSPKGWGLTGKDIGIVCLDAKYEKIVTDNYSSALNECENVIIFPSVRDLDIKISIIPKIYEAIQKKKSIYICIDLSEKEIYEITIEARKNKVQLNFYNNSLLDVPLNISHLLQSPSMRTIKTPIISVATIIEGLGEFSAQLQLARYANDLGYKVSVISTKPYASFCGIHPVPSFLFDKKYSENEKVVLFNHYVDRIDKQENPDLIIIGIPGALMPMKISDCENFGITPFEISRAVSPDTSLLMLYYDAHKIDHLKEMIKILNFRFSLNIDSIIMNNIMYDFADISPQASYLPPNFVEKNEILGQTEFPIFGPSSIDKSFENAIKILSGYADVNIL